jgi:glycosyltransferase involved in cell wall biosynthesis
VRVIGEASALARGDEPPPPGPYVLGVGDLRAKKNWGVLVAAMRRLDVPHRLILAGVDAGAGAALAGPGVELAGYVTDSRLDALMRGAAALVHPSLYEGFGLVLVEAMARGCPVLAADATALPATLGGAGVLFDPRDPADLAEKLGAVLADPGDLPARGRARAAELSWERTAAETAAVYRELA